MKDRMTRRELLQTTAAAAAVGIAAQGPAVAEPGTKGLRAAAGAADAPAQPWYRRLLVGIEWGPTGANDKDEIYLARATGRQIMQHQRIAQSQYAVVFMKDMEFAYYNSRVARKCPNLGQRDLLSECLDEARGMPVIAYCQVQYDSSSWRAHPEWRMKDQAGNDIDGRLCFNSGYLEFIKQVTTEMMQYAISGFHIDMLDFGFGPPYGCWCQSCQTMFQDQHGMALPAGPTWDEAWDKMLEFRCQSNTRFCRELAAFIKAGRPDISVDFNYHGYPPFSWETGERPVLHAANGDFVTAEGLPFIFGHTNPSLLALFMAGARPKGPFQAVTSRTVHGYHDFNVRPVAELKWEVFTYLAHGAQCTIVDKANYDGGLDRLAYERIGEVFGEARRERDTFGHEPLAEVGLYYSSRSRDWYGRDDRPKYMAAFWGAHKALCQSQITLGMIMDENVSLARLRDFPVVYLPNTAILTPDEVELFGRYVKGGGHLLVTGLTGVCDRYGQPQKESALAEIIGARLVRCQTEHPDNYVRLPADLARGAGKFLLADIPADWPMLAWGPIAVYEPAAAQAFGQLLIAYRSQNNQWSRHMSAAEAVGPALLVHRHGKGTVLCAPSAVDAAFVGDFRMPEQRKFIRNMIRYLNPDPPVLVRAPANVEIVVTRDAAGNRLLVHLLAFSPSTTAAATSFPGGTRVLPPVMEEPLQYTAHIRLQRPPARATATSRQREVTATGRELVLRTAEPHEVLIIEI